LRAEPPARRARLFALRASRFALRAKRFGLCASLCALRARLFGLHATRNVLRAKLGGLRTKRFALGARRDGLRATCKHLARETKRLARKAPNLAGRVECVAHGIGQRDHRVGIGARSPRRGLRGAIGGRYSVCNKNGTHGRGAMAAAQCARGGVSSTSQRRQVLGHPMQHLAARRERKCFAHQALASNLPCVHEVLGQHCLSWQVGLINS